MSQLERVLWGPRELLDSFSITAALNTDLKGRIYKGPLAVEMPWKFGLPKLKAVIEQKALTLETPRKLDLPQSKALTPMDRKALADLHRETEPLSVKEIARGFVDEDGAQVWIIEDVLEYHPKKGYKVKWIGWEEPTWNDSKDMPRTDPWCNGRMAKLRSAYCRDTQ
jgi:hypothetical protein